ncbi:hypothetical protein B7463_g7720, partial [Scytalidium lignicola]
MSYYDSASSHYYYQHTNQTQQPQQQQPQQYQQPQQPQQAQQPQQYQQSQQDQSSWVWDSVPHYRLTDAIIVLLKMSEKEQLIVACDEAVKFPQNLTHHSSSGYAQKSYTRRLDGQEARLFCRDDSRMRLDILEYDERIQTFEEHIIPNIAVLKQHFNDNLYDKRPDSKCTYISKKDISWSPMSSPATGLPENPTFRSQKTWSSFLTGLSQKPTLKSKITQHKQKFALPPLQTSQPQSPLPSGIQPPFPFVGEFNNSNAQTSGTSGQEQFSFKSLQRVQSLEDKSNEVLLILEANISVLSEMTSFYKSFVSSENCPNEHKEIWKRQVLRFEKKIESIICEIRMQITITKTLLRLLADRKTLLYGILQHSSMEANNLLAQKAQQSAENMEKMTMDMNAIAVKTKQETVSMRIITLVTLFFLPGTFVSTIMSTSIVQWDRNADGESKENFQMAALKVYLIITVPLMVVSFGAWYGVYWWVDRKERNKSKEMVQKGNKDMV